MKRLSVIVKNGDNDLKNNINDLLNDVEIIFTDNYNSVLNKIDTEYFMFINTHENYNFHSIISNFLQDNNNADIYFINHYFKVINKIYDKVINNDNAYLSSNNINLYVYNYIFKTQLLDNNRFNEDYEIEFNIDFVSNLIKKTDNIYVLCDLEKKLLETNADMYKHNKQWYFDSLDLYKKVLTNSDNLFIKYSILNMLSNKYFVNLNSKNTHVLDTEDLKQFELKVKEVLDLLDDDIIKNYFDYNNHYALHYTFLNIKYQNKQINIEKKYANIEIIEYFDNKLNIEFMIPVLERKDKEKVFLYLNDEKIVPIETNVYSKTNYFGKCYYESKTFKCKIEKSKLKDKNIITIKTNDYNFLLSFTKPMSKVSELLKYSYYNFDKFVLKCDNNHIYITKTNSFEKVINEIKFLFDILKSKNIRNKKFLSLKSFCLRILYWITKPFYKKKVWIAYDKLYKAGDNGEYFFHYVYNHDKNINMYYVINKTAKDYERLKNHKNILVYRSLKHYLKVLNAQSIFSTHANPYSYNGFAQTIDPYFRNLLTFDVFCIQHGLSVNQIAKFQNRVYANTKLYFCASPFEINNLKDKSYDYDEKQLLLTGIPRFDGLKNNSKKQILITPTWRQDVVVQSNKLNEARGHNDEFKDSVYYKTYMSLITNEKLVNCAKKYNYEIIYLLHPAIAGQIDDFPKDIYTKVLASTSDVSYETILRQSALMITDYSGVQFDFAYMKKPIIYYHPDSLPPHYEEGGLKYDKEGFGIVVKNEEKLVDSICEYIKNGCKNDKKYINRVDKFFAYDDFNSCKRIYNAAKNYYKIKKN